jgi:hypothetical protein
VTGAKRKRGGAVWAGGVTRWAALAGGACARLRGKKGRRPGVGFRLREKEKEKWAGERWAGREKGRGERGFGVFFLNSFQIHFSNFQTLLKQETMHSNHDAQALVIPNFIKMMFKYFKGQFI